MRTLYISKYGFETEEIKYKEQTFYEKYFKCLKQFHVNETLKKLYKI